MQDEQQLPTTRRPLTVLRLDVDGFMRLRVARLRPRATGLVVVHGRNKAGKSSLLNALAALLDPDEKFEAPITEGEHTAEVVADLGDLVVKGHWTRDSSGAAKRALTVEDAEGHPKRRPVEVLKSLRSKCADPVAFLGLPAADQVKTVLAITGLGAPLQELQDRAGAHYDRRRDLGRDADRLAKAHAEIAAEVEGLPAPTVEGDAQQLADMLARAKDHNAALAAIAQERATAETRGFDLQRRIAAVELQLADLRAQKAAVSAEWKAADARLVAMPGHVDTDGIVAALAEHEERARWEGKRELLERARAAADTARAAHAAEDASLEQVRAEIAQLLGTAAFPVEGMRYDPDEKALSVNGVPLSQASQAERIQIGASIAMAGDPEIGVFFVRDGSLIDDESRAQLEEIALAHGWQVWFESVASRAQGTGVWIEAGEAHQLDEDPA